MAITAAQGSLLFSSRIPPSAGAKFCVLTPQHRARVRPSGSLQLCGITLQLSRSTVKKSDLVQRVRRLRSPAFMRRGLWSAKSCINVPAQALEVTFAARVIEPRNLETVAHQLHYFRHAHTAFLVQRAQILIHVGPEIGGVVGIHG